MNLQELIGLKARKLELEFGHLAAQIEHNLSAGEAREGVLRSLLTEYLPKRAGVGRGFVIDSGGHVSKQIDVVIYDAQYAPILDVAGTQFFPVETVIAVGEVKTDVVSVETLKNALEKIESVKALDRTTGGLALPITGPGLSHAALVPYDPAKNHRDQVFGFIFTRFALSKETFIEAMLSRMAETPRQQWPNLICAFGDYIVSHCTGQHDEQGALFTSAMDSECIYVTKETEKPNLLHLFLALLSQFVDEAHVARVNMLAYGGITKTQADHYGLGPSAPPV